MSPPDDLVLIRHGAAEGDVVISLGTAGDPARCTAAFAYRSANSGGRGNIGTTVRSVGDRLDGAAGPIEWGHER